LTKNNETVKKYVKNEKNINQKDEKKINKWNLLLHLIGPLCGGNDCQLIGFLRHRRHLRHIRNSSVHFRQANRQLLQYLSPHIPY